MSAQTQYDLEGLEILLIDDNPHMRRIIRSILNSLGVKNVREADAAESGIEILKDFKPDLILVSWLIGAIDGPGFVKMIRMGNKSPNPYVPIIMLSAFTEKFRITEARDAGINEFLAKPLSPKSLYQRIATIIEKPRPFIRTASFFGPCRRRQDLGPPKGCVERRQADPTPVSAKIEKLQDVAPSE